MLAVLLAHHPALDEVGRVAFGDASRAKEMLARDPALAAARNRLGWTALHLASYLGNVAVARTLLDAGADVDAVASSRFKNTPLQVAMLTQQVEVAALLLARGASVRHRQEGGFTALHEATQAGSRSLVAALLAAGADPAARADDGRTPLDVARARGEARLLALLAAALPRAAQ